MVNAQKILRQLKLFTGCTTSLKIFYQLLKTGCLSLKKEKSPVLCRTVDPKVKDQQSYIIPHAADSSLWQQFLLIFLRTNVIFCTKQA